MILGLSGVRGAGDGLGRQGAVQDELLIGWHEMPVAPGHAFYNRLNGLFDEVALLGVIPGEVEQRDDPAEQNRKDQDRDDADPSVDIGIAMKELAHRVDIRRP